MTLSPTTQYWLGWITLGAAFLVAFRLFVINPLVQEAQALRAEVAALRQK